MVISGSRPNKYTYPPLFKACTSERAIEEGLQIHGHVVKLGLNSDAHIVSAGIRMYASLGYLQEARNMFDLIGKSDLICCNAMINGYTKFGDVEAAMELFQNSVASWKTVISGLFTNEMAEEAQKLFDEIPHKDEVSWSAMIDGYNKLGYFKEVWKFLVRCNTTRSGQVSSYFQVHCLLPQMWEASSKENGFMITQEIIDIHLQLEKMMQEIKLNGHKPDTSQVSFEISDEEKETALNHHSEKLAIALRILRTEPGSIIRVVKNLRVIDLKNLQV